MMFWKEFWKLSRILFLAFLSIIGMVVLWGGLAYGFGLLVHTFFPGEITPDRFMALGSFILVVAAIFSILSFVTSILVMIAWGRAKTKGAP